MELIEKDRVEIFEEEGKLGIKVEDRIIVPAVYNKLTRLEGGNVFRAVVDAGEYAGVYYINAYGESLNGVAPHYRELVECYERWRKLPAELAEAQRNVAILRNERQQLKAIADNYIQINNTLHERIKELREGTPSSSDYVDARVSLQKLEKAESLLTSKEEKLVQLLAKVKELIVSNAELRDEKANAENMCELLQSRIKELEKEKNNIVSVCKIYELRVVELEAMVKEQKKEDVK